MIDDDDDPYEHLDEAVSPETPVDDNASPKAYRAKQKEQAIREGEREQFWRAVLFSDVGRREMWGVLQDAHYDTAAFGITPAGMADPLKSYFELGQQAFGHRFFLTLMRYAHEATMLMLKEHDIRLREPEPPKRIRRKGGG